MSGKEQGAKKVKGRIGKGLPRAAKCGVGWGGWLGQRRAGAATKNGCAHCISRSTSKGAGGDQTCIAKQANSALKTGGGEQRKRSWVGPSVAGYHGGRQGHTF